METMFNHHLFPNSSSNIFAYYGKRAIQKYECKMFKRLKEADSALKTRKLIFKTNKQNNTSADLFSQSRLA